MATDNHTREASTMDRRIARPARRLWFGAGLVAAACLLGILGYRSIDTSTSYTLDGQRLRIAAVETDVYEDYLPLRASVEPERTVYMDAIDGGRVDAVLVEEGAIVEKGQTLIELSNTQLQLDVIAREAQVSEQLNNLRNTQLAIEQNRLALKRDLIEIDYQITRLTRLVDRHEALEGRQLLSRDEYESSLDELTYWQDRRLVTLESQVQDEKVRITQIGQLEASVAQLEKNLELARANLDNLVVRAPRAGKLTSLNAEVGESKARGENLGQIDDVDRFKATALVNEFYLSRVRVGQRARLTVDGEAYELEVDKIYPEVEAAQFEIDLAFVGAPPPGVRRGQTLNARLVLGDTTERATLLPNGPFLTDTGGAWVFVLDASGNVAHRRTVQFGRRNPKAVEVLAGLEPGDRVVVSSYASFIGVERLIINP